ncbi:hypothetical protein SAMN02745903_04870 [Pseudomonas sp. URMO17WK12:I5]|nr:hypothetical protein SAMN02745903_04870 [Pseudomonas sp. URMO17WK12:I5]
MVVCLGACLKPCIQGGQRCPHRSDWPETDVAPPARRIADESAPTFVATCRTCYAMVVCLGACLKPCIQGGQRCPHRSDWPETDVAPPARRIADESAPTFVATCRTCYAMVACLGACLKPCIQGGQRCPYRSDWPETDVAPPARRIADESAPTFVATCRTCYAMVVCLGACLKPCIQGGQRCPHRSDWPETDVGADSSAMRRAGGAR